MVCGFAISGGLFSHFAGQETGAWDSPTTLPEASERETSPDWSGGRGDCGEGWLVSHQLATGSPRSVAAVSGRSRDYLRWRISCLPTATVLTEPQLLIPSLPTWARNASETPSEPVNGASHGMFHLLPWSTGIGGNKGSVQDLKMLVAEHASPILNATSMSMLKRKRADSDDATAPPGTKRCLDPIAPTATVDATMNAAATAPQLPIGNNVAPAPTPTPTPPSRLQENNDKNSQVPKPDSMDTAQDRDGVARGQRSQVDVDKLRQTLDAQLSLEILLKHNELRLIDQEIAKCQIALEQLRRCAEIPYPGSHLTGMSQSVSNGTGFAIPYTGHGPAPVSPAPWGVTDGPYSRHYAKWLIPDPRFDGGEVETPAQHGYGSMDGRTTRGSLGDHGYVAGKSRSQRGSANVKLQSLPSGYPAPKEKAGPMIMKRKSDGKTVKLVCLDCRRFDFSSTQGFINHCRIAHGRTFASHDAAAEACGEPVEVDEAGAVVGATTDSSSGSSVATAPGFVHPLIRSAHTIDTSKNSISAVSSPAATARSADSSSLPKPSSRPSQTPDPSFKASPETPHLSSLLAGRGIGVDLQEIVGDAKATIDLDQFSSDEESDQEADGTLEDRSQLSFRGGRLPAHTTDHQGKNQKGSDKPRNRNQPRPLDLSAPTTSTFDPTYQAASSDLADNGNAIPITDGENLSPHTVTSNQAPSLVSDDDDDDDEFEAPSESEDSSPASSEVAPDEDIDDFEVEDDEGTATSTTTDTKTDPDLATPARLTRGHGKKKDRMLIVSLNRGGDGERRVSFVTGQTKSKKDGGRKPNR